MTKLKPRDTQSTIIRRLRSQNGYLQAQLDAARVRVEDLTVELAAERTAQQAVARRRSYGNEHGYKNGG